MFTLGGRYRNLSASWRYGLVGGVLAVPFVAASYLQTGSSMSLGAVFFGGLLSGFLAARGGETARGVGTRTGLVGATPVLWVGFDLVTATSALSGPGWFVAAGTGLTAVVVVGFCLFAFALSGLVGEVGGRVGGWVGDTGEGSTPTGAGG